MQPLLYRRPVSGDNRDVDFKSKADLLALIEHLEKQGSRVEWRGKNRSNAGMNADGSEHLGTVGKFPAKVWPPDKTKHFILFHGTQSDRNAATLKRGEVRRAGLTWPGEDVPRKETPMSIAPPTHLRQHGHHLMQPAGARQMKHPPTPETAGRFLPVVSKLTDGFWTDDVLKALNDAQVPGYGANGAMQRVQGLLDWAGYRVTEVRRNRNGWAYRWAHEAVARAMAEPRVTPIRPQVEQPVQNHEEPKASFTPDPSEDLPGFETPVPRTKRHERKQCPECERWFAPDGYEHHIEATGHGQLQPITETLSIVPAIVPDPTPAPASEPLQPNTTTMSSAERAARLREAGFDDENTALWQADADLNAMEALAFEAQEDAAALRRELADASEAYGRLTEKFAGERATLAREREAAAIADGQRQQEVLMAREQERAKHEDAVRDAGTKLEAAIEARATIFQVLEQEREAHARALEDISAAHDEAIESLRESAGSPDGSWVLASETVRNYSIADLQQDGERLGILIEVRARRA